MTSSGDSVRFIRMWLRLDSLVLFFFTSVLLFFPNWTQKFNLGYKELCLVLASRSDPTR